MQDYEHCRCGLPPAVKDLTMLFMLSYKCINYYIYSAFWIILVFNLDHQILTCTTGLSSLTHTVCIYIYIYIYIYMGGLHACEHGALQLFDFFRIICALLISSHWCIIICQK